MGSGHAANTTPARPQPETGSRMRLRRPDLLPIQALGTPSPWGASRSRQDFIGDGSALKARPIGHVPWPRPYLLLFFNLFELDILILLTTAGLEVPKMMRFTVLDMATLGTQVLISIDRNCECF
ncbi:hypothetical protein NDU88_003280 [Pleurodeles waltl]|uniref:Uncharacterized protein n=1 Tax=Pleurodeles waltl TaxID=8319 RepID=A0AAV7UBM3_PLEWA|nr:hypothetical protein NDU88_003280 [Pleurodeles waltl]